ncbi:MAG TPA: tetratricopeptide repeat protein [Polyangiaceae bacterium]|nr:tetratricopeptide repeat protein [Polyangiaceae bacterium]
MLLLALLVTGCSKPPVVERAALLSSKGREGEAIALLDEYLSHHPRAVPERRLLIRLCAEASDLGRAEREAAKLASVLPADSPVPWVEMGHALEIAHRYEEALSMYDRAAEVAPRDPLGPRTGGLRAARWGETELAAPRLEEALRRNPRAADVWHALGLVRLHLGDLDGAQVAYRSGLVADPGALENRIGLATVALERGAPADALREYDVVIQARPMFGDGYLGRAWALIALGRFDEAAASLDEARRHGADARAIDRQTRLLTRLAARTANATKTREEKGTNP